MVGCGWRWLEVVDSGWWWWLEVVACGMAWWEVDDGGYWGTESRVVELV